MLPPRFLNRTDRFEFFKKRGMELYDGKYDYRKFEYIDAKHASIIICPVHGEFFQKPDHHLRKDAHGCQQCWNDLKSSGYLRKSPRVIKVKYRLSITTMEKRCREKFGDRYSYDFTNHKSIHTGFIIIGCPVHGEHTNTLAAHLQSGTGCPKCGMEKKSRSKTKSFDKFIEDVKQVHTNDFIVLESNRITFTNRSSKVECECSKHGTFIKKGQKILVGQGCPDCKMEKAIADGKFPGGYCERVFEDNPSLKDKKATLYYLKINDDIFKIGISKTNVNNRVRAIKSKSKGEVISIEIVSKMETTLYDAYMKEQTILKKFYRNRRVRAWSTELFNCDVLAGRPLQSF